MIANPVMFYVLNAPKLVNAQLVLLVQIEEELLIALVILVLLLTDYLVLYVTNIVLLAKIQLLIA